MYVCSACVLHALESVGVCVSMYMHMEFKVRRYLVSSFVVLQPIASSQGLTLEPGQLTCQQALESYLSVMLNARVTSLHRRAQPWRFKLMFVKQVLDTLNHCPGL